MESSGQLTGELELEQLSSTRTENKIGQRIREILVAPHYCCILLCDHTIFRSNRHSKPCRDLTNEHTLFII